MSKVKVKAVRLGFLDGSRIKADSIFFVEESRFSKLWMEKLEEVEVHRFEPKKPKKSKEKPSKPEKVEKEEEELDVI